MTKSGMTVPKSGIPAYMHPAVSRMLLAMSRQRRVRVQLQRALRKQHWSDSAAAELADIHIKLNPEADHART